MGNLKFMNCLKTLHFVQSVILAHFLYFFFLQLLVSGLQYLALMLEVGKVRNLNLFEGILISKVDA